MAGAAERVDPAFTDAGIELVRPVADDESPRGLGLKHAQDRVLAGLLVLALVPLLVVIALLVKLTSRGPVLYRALRVGEAGSTFDMLKFRTMTGSPVTRGEADADWAASVLRTSGSVTNLRPKPARDESELVTLVGRFLRRTCLDELPQLWNVLRGDMAIVGPRPERVAYSELFSSVIYRYSDRIRVRPGITGWAQVHGLRGRTSLADRVEQDNFYIDNWSPLLDLKILALTPLAVLRAKHMRI